MGCVTRIREGAATRQDCFLFGSLRVCGNTLAQCDCDERVQLVLNIAREQIASSAGRSEPPGIACFRLVKTVIQETRPTRRAPARIDPKMRERRNSNWRNPPPEGLCGATVGTPLSRPKTTLDAPS